MLNSLPTRFFSSISAVFTTALVLHAADETTPLTEQINSRINVHGAKDLVGGAESVDWNKDTGTLLVGVRNGADPYNVFRTHPSHGKLFNITEDRSGSARLHNGHPEWLAGGHYFVFTGQIRFGSSYTKSVPDKGENCNIWIGEKSGRNFWKLTDNTARYSGGSGAHSPCVSPDMTKLAWTGPVGNESSNHIWGEHAMYMADLTFENEKPKIGESNMIALGGRKDYLETYMFSSDDNKLLFGGNLEYGQPISGMDVYMLDMEKQKLLNLSNRQDSWDRYAAISPDGNKIVWASSRSFNIPYLPYSGDLWKNHLVSEIWIMNADGQSKRRLTHFNEDGYPESRKGRRIYVGEMSWNADGTKLAVCVFEEVRSRTVQPKLVMLDLGYGPAPRQVKETDEKNPAAEPVKKKPVKKISPFSREYSPGQ